MIDNAVAQGMTRSGRFYAPENINERVLSEEQNPKKNVIDSEAVEFYMKMQFKDYSIKEQLKKTSFHILIWSLLMSYEYYRNSLMEGLSRVIIQRDHK